MTIRAIRADLGPFHECFRSRRAVKTREGKCADPASACPSHLIANSRCRTSVTTEPTTLAIPLATVIVCASSNWRDLAGHSIESGPQIGSFVGMKKSTEPCRPSREMWRGAMGTEDLHGRDLPLRRWHLQRRGRLLPLLEVCKHLPSQRGIRSTNTAQESCETLFGAVRLQTAYKRRTRRRNVRSTALCAAWLEN